MKRHPALLQLSREHHPALVLAKRAQSLADDNLEAAADFAAEIRAVFAAELEPHFCIEEERLLPLLKNAGQAQLVERTLAEHANLRALAVQIDAGDPASLRRFGALLAAHVRFEERELFPAAEATLEPEALAMIDHAPQSAACRTRTPH